MWLYDNVFCAESILAAGFNLHSEASAREEIENCAADVAGIAGTRFRQETEFLALRPLLDLFRAVGCVDLR